MNSAPDIVSKIREALEGAGACITVHSERLGDALDNEGNNEPQFACEATYACDKILEALALLPHLEAMMAREPVSGEKCRRAVGQLFFRFRDDLAARGHKAIYESYPSSNEIVKAVLDAAGVPYAE